MVNKGLIALVLGSVLTGCQVEKHDPDRFNKEEQKRYDEEMKKYDLSKVLILYQSSEQSLKE